VKIQDAIKEFQEGWGVKTYRRKRRKQDDSYRNDASKEEEFFDPARARELVRPEVEKELEDVVDKLIAAEIEDMRKHYMGYVIKETKAQKRDKKKRKKKIRSEMKKKKRLEKKKLKKAKKAPGRVETKNMSIEKMLEECISVGICKKLEPAKVEDLVGEHDSLRDHSEMVQTEKMKSEVEG